MQTPAATNVLVGFFNSCKRTSGVTNISLTNILHGIKTGEWAKRIQSLRKLVYPSEAYSSAKRSLPCFMVSGSSRRGHRKEDLEIYSGCLQIDIDNLGEAESIVLRDRLGDDCHILAAWLSPSNRGVKAIIRIPSDISIHKQSFVRVSSYIKTNFGAEIDPSCKDVCRLCFVSFDPDLRINDNAVPLEVSHIHQEVEEASTLNTLSKTPPSTTLYSSTALHTSFCDTTLYETTGYDATIYESAILHNTAPPNLKSSPFLKDLPELHSLYIAHVVRGIGVPRHGSRNECLVDLASTLYCVVAPKFIWAFIWEFYRQHQDVFSGYPSSNVRREVTSTLAGCENNYDQKRLNELERHVYLGLLDERDRIAFRICQSLSLYEADNAPPPPLFALSSEHLGARLGCNSMPARRILKRFEKAGILEIVSVGTKRSEKKPGVATKFKWLLNSTV